MKRSLSFAILHRTFAVGALLIIGGLFAFLAYVYVAFNGILTGDVQVELSPDLLTNLQTQRFDAAVARMERRRSLPPLPPDMPDPFDAPVRQSAP
ncbi:MAG TPA: hypothetical protein VL283_01095 [Candidatus Baltobacteraceae bacterium]|nr:hypothetical protein [Candidatus Baltobacteraceae bacterium]